MAKSTMTDLWRGIALSGGQLLVSQRHAIITQLLKKSSLNPAELKNYRPVSNLTVMSKIVEKLVSGQLVGYLQSNNLMPHFQSAFCRHHSTETALLRVISDIVGAVDRGSGTLLGLLDLSAAFDTVDHTILLDRLRIRFGVGSGVLGWIRTFLVGRTQQVLYMGRLSSIGRLDFGVPQGSVLGPLLFLLYTAELWRSSTERGWWHTHTLMIRRCISVYQPPNHRSQLGSSRSALRRSTVGCSQTIQNEHRQNPADLDRNAPAAVKGRHQ